MLANPHRHHAVWLNLSLPVAAAAMIPLLVWGRRHSSAPRAKPASQEAEIARTLWSGVARKAPNDPCRSNKQICPNASLQDCLTKASLESEAATRRNVRARQGSAG